MNAFPIQLEAALVSWDPSDANADAVRAAFTAGGFEDLCPKARTEYEALKEAMATLKAKDQKIERHKAHEKNGCEIMQVERDAEVNEYARRRGARVVDGQVVCDPPLEFVEQYAVQGLFEKSLAEVPSRELSNALVAVVLGKLNGQRLRERGALYFIPQESIPKWYLLSDLLDVGAGVKLFAAETNINERTAEWVIGALCDRVLHHDLCRERWEAGLIVLDAQWECWKEAVLIGGKPMSDCWKPGWQMPSRFRTEALPLIVRATMPEGVNS